MEKIRVTKMVVRQEKVMAAVVVEQAVSELCPSSLSSSFAESLDNIDTNVLAVTEMLPE